MEHLRESLHTLVVEQQELYQKAAHSALSIGRLHQRLVVMERYFLALTRKGVAPEPEEGAVGEELEEVEHGAVEEREAGGVTKPELPESVKRKKEESESREKRPSTSIDTNTRYIHITMLQPINRTLQRETCKNPANHCICYKCVLISKPHQVHDFLVHINRLSDHCIHPEGCG